MKEIEKFYSNLYATNDDTVYENNPFVQGMEIPKLCDDMRNICEGRLSTKECFVEMRRQNFSFIVYILAIFIIMQSCHENDCMLAA